MSPEGRALRRARQEQVRAWLLEEGGPCRVKLCGMYLAEDIAAVNALQPDLVGFITDFPKSHRNLSSGDMGRLALQVDGAVRTVSVSADLPFGRVGHNAEHYVDLVQLHGSEDETYLSGLRMRTAAGIIQAFRIRSEADVERALRSSADMVLLDAGQGSGETFDWSLIEGFGARRPYILAGGLGPDNVAQAVRELRPWGVDMSSGIETDKRKDPKKMAAAVAAVRSVQ